MKSNAWLDGWHAHKNGVDISHNPYREISQKTSYHHWVAGWCNRFGCVKNDEPLLYDDELFVE